MANKDFRPLRLETIAGEFSVILEEEGKAPTIQAIPRSLSPLFQSIINVMASEYKRGWADCYDKQVMQISSSERADIEG